MRGALSRSLSGLCSLLTLALLSALPPALLCEAQAQTGTTAAVMPRNWPARPIRILVPFSAGAAADLNARVIAPRLSERLGTPVLIENRPGAAGIIAMDAAARAAADGYTLLFANLTLVTGPVLFEMNFDPLTELVPVVQLTEFYYVLLAANNFAPRTAAEVLALGRSQPGRVSCASGGGMSEFGCALLRALGRIDINQVRYKGNGPAMNDLAGGQVNLLFDIASVAGASVRSGRARALATTAAPAVVPAVNPAANPAANLAASRPAGQFAALPLMAELLPGFEVTGWQGLVTRSGTHPDIVARLNREVRAVLQIDEVRQRLQEEGVSIVAGSSEQFGEMIRSHGAKVLRLIKAHQIRIE